MPASSRFSSSPNPEGAQLWRGRWSGAPYRYRSELVFWRAACFLQLFGVRARAVPHDDPQVCMTRAPTPARHPPASRTSRNLCVHWSSYTTDAQPDGAPTHRRRQGYVRALQVQHDIE